MKLKMATMGKAYKGSMSVGQLKQRAERLQGKLDKLEEK